MRDTHSGETYGVSNGHVLLMDKRGKVESSPVKRDKGECISVVQPSTQICNRRLADIREFVRHANAKAKMMSYVEPRTMRLPGEANSELKAWKKRKRQLIVWKVEYAHLGLVQSEGGPCWKDFGLAKMRLSK